MHLAVINHSPDVGPAQVQQMCAAIGHQVKYDYAPAWDAVPTEVTYYATPAQVPAGSPIIGIFQDADQPGALGYHTEGVSGSGLVVTGKVFTGVTLENGGTILDGPLSITSVLSHEVLELLADPRVNAWADTGGGKLVAWELCDPVESDTYEYGGCSLSNFVLPAWFDPQAAGHGPFDHLGRLSKPFTMTRGGYLIYATMGAEKQATARRVEVEFGDQFPAWKKAGKLESELARSYRRLEG